MPAIFNSVVKTKKDDSKGDVWYIELTDTTDGRVALCDNLDDYEASISFLGDDYGGDIEVVWSHDKDVSAEQIYDVRVAMSKYHEKYKDQIEDQEGRFKWKK